MKSAIILNVLATMFLLGVGDATRDVGIFVIKGLNGTIAKIIKDLRLHGEQMSSALVTIEDEFKTRCLAFLDEDVDMYVSQLKSFIESAEEQSDAVDYCLKWANQTLQLNMKNINIDQCGNEARSFVELTTHDINATIQFGNRIVHKLNKIIVNCTLSNIKPMQNCIIPKIIKPRRSVKQLRSNANTLMEINLTMFRPETRLACFQFARANFPNNFENVKTDTFKCIEEVRELIENLRNRQKYYYRVEENVDEPLLKFLNESTA